MHSNLRTLGANEARVLLTLLEEGREVVTASDIMLILDGEKKSRKVIESLLKKGWIVRLGDGRYMIQPPNRGPENYGENNALAMASAAIDPSYVGWWSAAAFHGLTTQRPITVTVATTKRVRPRIIEGTHIKFIKLSQGEFFGFRVFTIYGRDTKISGIEKTVIDCIDRPRLCGGVSEVTRIVYGAMRVGNPADLAEAAVRMKSVSLLQRLGFLADLVGWDLPTDIRAELRNRIPPSARSVLGAEKMRDTDIGFVSDWGLIVNASRQGLLADVPHEGSSPK